MNSDEREEIAASVAAHAELGPKYDTAVAEGLVERIGEEIDRRVDARLRSMGQHSPASHPVPNSAPNSVPRQAYTSPGHQIVPPGYHGQQAVPGSAPGPASSPSTADPPAPARRSNGVSGVFLGLGSIGLAVGATAIVASHHAASLAQVFMILLIWLAIAAVNIAHSQRR